MPATLHLPYHLPYQGSDVTTSEHDAGMAQTTKNTATRRPKGMGSLEKAEDVSGLWVWRVWWTNPCTGKKSRLTRHLHATSRSKAEQLVVQQLAELKNMAEDPKRPTMDKVFETWLALLDNGGYSFKHIHESKRIYRTVWQPKLGQMLVSDITVHDINNILAPLRQDRSARTLRKLVSALSAPLQEATKTGYIDFNPARRVSLGKVTPSQVDMMTPEEGTAIINYIEERNVVVAEVCRFLRVSGMRRGEVCALCWDSVELDGDSPYVQVKAGVEQIGGIVATKTMVKTDAGYRRIPLSEGMVKRFKKWRLAREAFAADHEMELMPNAFIFSLLPDGSEPVKPDLVTKWVGKASDALVEQGVLTRHCHPHMWRHAVPSILLAEGWDVKNVQRLMGHASAAMTLNVYASAIPDHQKMAASLDSMGQDG